MKVNRMWAIESNGVTFTLENPWIVIRDKGIMKFIELKGDKDHMKNAEWCIEQGIELKDIYATQIDKDSFDITVADCDKQGYQCNRKIGHIERERDGLYQGNRAIIEWLGEERREPILDDAEKEYLSAVIKPWIDL